MQFVAFGVRDMVTLEKAVSLLTRLIADLIEGFRLDGEEKKLTCQFFVRLGSGDKKSVLVVHSFRYTVDGYECSTDLEGARYSPYMPTTQREFPIPKGVRAAEFLELITERAYQVGLMKWGMMTERRVTIVLKPDFINNHSQFIIEFSKKKRAY
jgi:hypothetical protein